MESEIYCNLGAMTSEQRQQYEAVRMRLFKQVQAVREIDNGFCWTFPDETLIDMASFVMLERICCSFLNFHITVSADSDAIELALIGSEDVKAFLRAEFGDVFEGGR